MQEISSTLQLSLARQAVSQSGCHSARVGNVDDERGTAIDHSTPQLQLVLMGVIANTIVPINSLSVCEWTTTTGGRASEQGTFVCVTPKYTGRRW